MGQSPELIGCLSPAFFLNSVSHWLVWAQSIAETALNTEVSSSRLLNVSACRMRHFFVLETVHRLMFHIQAVWWEESSGCGMLRPLPQAQDECQRWRCHCGDQCSWRRRGRSAGEPQQPWRPLVPAPDLPTTGSSTHLLLQPQVSEKQHNGADCSSFACW